MRLWLRLLRSILWFSAESLFKNLEYYFFTIHKTAKRAEVTDEFALEVLGRHTQYFLELGENGKCILAGPFVDQSTELGGGCYVLSVRGESEAVELADADPLVKEGLYSYEMTEWKRVVPA